MDRTTTVQRGWTHKAENAEIAALFGSEGITRSVSFLIESCAVRADSCLINVARLKEVEAKTSAYGVAIK